MSSLTLVQVSKTSQYAADYDDV